MDQKRSRLALLVIAWLVCALFFQGVFYPALNKETGKDLSIYLEGGRTYQRHGNVYWFSRAGYGDNFVYPPYTLPVFAWLSTLPPSAVRSGWIALSALGLLSALALLIRHSASMSPLPALALAALGLLFSPAGESLRLGQVDGFILLAILFFIYGYNHPNRLVRYASEIIFALLASVKYTPFALLAIPLARGEYRKVFRVLAVFAALLAISWAFQGAPIWRDYLPMLQTISTGMVYGWTTNSFPSLIFTTLRRIGWLDPTLNLSVFDTLVVGVTLLAYLACVLRFRRQRETPTGLLLLGTVFMITISKLVWYYHLIYLLPAAIYFLSQYQRRFKRLDDVILLALLLIHLSPVVIYWTEWNGFSILGYYVFLFRVALLPAGGEDDRA